MGTCPAELEYHLSIEPGRIDTYPQLKAFMLELMKHNLDPMETDDMASLAHGSLEQDAMPKVEAGDKYTAKEQDMMARLEGGRSGTHMAYQHRLYKPKLKRPRTTIMERREGHPPIQVLEPWRERGQYNM